VGHTEAELRPERTLQRLYLDPLERRVQQHGGRVYTGGPTLTLLIDLKSDGPSTYRALSQILPRYASLLTIYRDGQRHEGAVQIIISGNRPIELIAAEPLRYVAVDGRLSDLGGSRPTALMPVISDRWTAHFRWQGNGPLPAPEHERLNRIVQQAHQRGQRVRFWATPDQAAVWRVLSEAQVDLINTDDLEGLAGFLRQKAAENGRPAGTQSGAACDPPVPDRPGSLPGRE
jgi:hypothetical protein